VAFAYHYFALELEARGELPVLLGPLAGEDRELACRLGLGDCLVPSSTAEAFKSSATTPEVSEPRMRPQRQLTRDRPSGPRDYRPVRHARGAGAGQGPRGRPPSPGTTHPRSCRLSLGHADGAAQTGPKTLPSPSSSAPPLTRTSKCATSRNRWSRVTSPRSGAKTPNSECA